MPNPNFIFLSLNELPQWFDDKMRVFFSRLVSNKRFEIIDINKIDNNTIELILEPISSSKARNPYRYKLVIRYFGIPIYPYSYTFVKERKNV